MYPLPTTYDRHAIKQNAARVVLFSNARVIIAWIRRIIANALMHAAHNIQSVSKVMRRSDSAWKNVPSFCLLTTICNLLFTLSIFLHIHRHPFIGHLCSCLVRMLINTVFYQYASALNILAISFRLFVWTSQKGQIFLFYFYFSISWRKFYYIQI